MSNCNRNIHAQGSSVIDYERQFQEDLERAQALSLESLALEKFKLQKQRLEYNNIQQSYQSQNNSHDGSSGSTMTDGALQSDK